MSGSRGIDRWSAETAAITALCLVGIVLRLYFFSLGRSLWFDEAMLALNIVDRSWGDLFKPLDFNQAAPVGFLLLQKIVVRVLGGSDYALRIIPLLAGVISVPLMGAVARAYLGKQHVLVPLALFALSPRLIYYAGEVKQYSTDVLAALALLGVGALCSHARGNPRSLALLGGAGSLFMCISHPALFLFAGLLLSLGISFAAQKNKPALIGLAGAAGAGMCVFAVLYWINLRHAEANKALTAYWAGKFAPLPPWDHLEWYLGAVLNMLRDPAKMDASLAVALLALVGAVSLVFRKPVFAIMLQAPFLLTLAASAVNRYPFSGRLILFLMPMLFLLIAEGMRAISARLSMLHARLGLLFYAAAVGYVLFRPLDIVWTELKNPSMGEHIKPLLATLSEQKHPDDIVYIYYGARFAFKFYQTKYGLEGCAYVHGAASRENPEKYIEDVEQLRGNRRVWFVFSHNCDWCVVNEEEFILEHLDRIGIKVAEYKSGAASMYLYDLNRHQQDASSEESDIE